MRRCSRCDFFNEDQHERCHRCGGQLAPRIIAQCRCGETYYAAEHQVGRKIQCSLCGSSLQVGKPPASRSRTTTSTGKPPRIIPAVGAARSGGISLSHFGKYALVGLAVVIFIVWLGGRSGRYERPNPLPQPPSALQTETSALQPAAPMWNAPPEQPLPANGGGVFFFDRVAAQSKLTIKPQSAQAHLVVKVENWQNSQVICWFFIHEGQSAETKIPAGKYRLKLARGKHWYGQDDLFGPDTSYSAVANQISIPENADYTVNLTPSPMGTLRETRLSPKDF